MLKYETPVVYQVIIEISPPHRKKAPSVEIISMVCRASGDPSFKKPKFSRYLDQYASEGLYCKRPKELTPERERYYERIRRTKMCRYIQTKREEIEQIRQFGFQDDSGDVRDKF